MSIGGRNLVLSYRSEAGPIPVLQSASLEAARGEIVLLNGPSGSGKTTLLSVLAGLLTPDSGAVIVNGIDITRLNRSERTRLRLTSLGFIFQSFNLVGALSALENAELVLCARGVPPREAREQAAEMLGRLGLAQKMERRPAQLSGGEQQRVAVARALAGNPAVILADEPTSSLDAHAGAAVIGALCDLARERSATVLIASHDERIKPFVDRVIDVVDGKC